MIAYNSELWDTIVTKGKENCKNKITNTLNKDDINTILATMEYFNASSTAMKQAYFDLTIPKFRIFDWLAMNIMGRNDDDRNLNNVSLKVLVHSFIKSNYDVKKFIADLRSTDYECDESWKEINIDLILKIK